MLRRHVLAPDMENAKMFPYEKKKQIWFVWFYEAFLSYPQRVTADEKWLLAKMVTMHDCQLLVTSSIIN